ncbi:MAG: hypothetical protein WD534_13300 [Phycisphaeraceae bacterium]
MPRLVQAGVMSACLLVPAAVQAQGEPGPGADVEVDPIAPAPHDYSAMLIRMASDEQVAQLAAQARDADAAPAARMQAAQALAHQRTPAAAEALLALTAAAQPEAVRTAAFTALASLAGRDDLGQDRDAWQTWWEQVRHLPPHAWQQHLLDNFARQRQQAQQQQQQLESRLVEAHRSLYRTVNAEERPIQLMRLLEDPLVVVRQLGLDLAVQRLVDDQPFDEALRTTLRARLDDPSPAVRQRVTLLLRDLADAPAAERVAQRLAGGEEQTEAVLRASLLLMSRLPRIEAVERSLELLADPALRDEAAQAIGAAVDADRLTYQQGMRALRQVRADLAIGNAPPQPSVVRLLGKLGGESDWQRMEGWLDAADVAVRQAAAQAWAGSDRSLRPLVDRLDDPQIQSIALLAAARRGESSATFRTLARFQPEGDQATEQWRRAMEAMAGRVPSDLVLTTVRELEQRDAPVALCRQMLAAALQQAEAVAHDGDEADHVALLLARGRLRLAAGEPEAALADFDQIPRLEVELSAAQRDQWNRGVIRATLWLDQFDRAFETAQAILDEANRAAADAEPGDEPALFSENDSPLDLLFEAADHSIAAGDLDRLDRLTTGLRALIGPAMGPGLSKRLATLDARAQHQREAADEGASDPAATESPDDDDDATDTEADGPA